MDFVKAVEAEINKALDESEKTGKRVKCDDLFNSLLHDFRGMFSRLSDARVKAAGPEGSRRRCSAHRPQDAVPLTPA